MEVDWDLHAVVRAYCCSTASSSSSSSSAAAPTTTTATVTAAPTYNQHNRNSQDETFLGFFPDPFQTRNEQFLNNLNNPLEFPKLQKPPPYPQSLPISPLSVIGGLQDPPLNLHHQHHQQKQIHGKQQSFSVSRCTTSNAQSTRSKKRKNQMKKVCQVPAEGLSSDVWSWRKYGQKPIKGSPYPRGYYKCSTSKGCLARKQVERNRSDPDMFILTYTGDHSHPVPTHRNSLAGSTRTKPTTTTTSGDDNDTTQTKPTSSPPVSPPASQSPATEKTEDNDTDDEDDTFDTIMDDDFFEGLDELVSPVAGDNSPATSFPWLSNTTTAAGGS